MSIRAQAEKLLYETGLHDMLGRYGKVCITGSYFLNMMTWNDLDLYLQPSDSFDFHAMAADIIGTLRPARFDGFTGDRGTFFGCETFITGQRWNVDIWVRSEEEIEQRTRYCRNLKQKIDVNPGAHQSILEIKSGLTAAGMYGFDKHPTRHYHSHDVYSAVLDKGISTLDEFLKKYPL